MKILTLLADILFIGPGLFGADLPQMVGAASRMGGAEAQALATEGGDAPLAYYWSNGSSGIGADPHVALASGQVDRLVMTEKIAEGDPVADPDTALLIANFADLAITGNAESQIFIQESWPPLELEPQAEQAWKQEVRAAADEWRLLAAMAGDARDSQAQPMRLIPLAQGLATVGDEIAAGNLPGLTSLAGLFADRQRLNDRGSYFAAMLIHAALTGEDPAGLPVWLGRNRPASLDEAITQPMAAAFQRIALQVVRDEVLIPLPEPPDEPTPQPEAVAEVPERDAAMEAAAAVATPPDAAPSDATPQSYLTGVAREGVAFNLSEVNDWTSEQPFLDVFKTARPWLGNLEGQWGGFEEKKLFEEGYLDENGWPLDIPPGTTGIGTLFLTDLPAEMQVIAGRYVLTYDGKGVIWLEGLVENLEEKPGEMQFDFRPGTGAVVLTLKEIDPDDPIRNIRVIRQDRLRLAEQGEIFNPDFLARMRGVEMIRFMQWMRTNNSELSLAKDLARPDDYTWATPRGVPPEVMIALANELQADPWFTLPHLAEDALVREFASIVRERLDPDLRVIAEFSNEIWNWIFAQADWADRMAQQEWGARDAWVEYGTYRAAQVARIWGEEFGDVGRDRLVRVVGAFTGWAGLEEQLLNAPSWQRANPDAYSTPVEAFDAYGITGYFSGNLESDDRVDMLRGWIADSHQAARREGEAQGLVGAALDDYVTRHRFDEAIDMALTEIRDGSLSGEWLGSVKWLNEEVYPYQRGVADKYGLDLLMYEGGTHVVSFSAGEDDALTEFFVTLNYSPGMAELTEMAWDGWKAVSDEPFNFFESVTAPSRYGSWGTLRYLDDDNPRWRLLSEPRP